MIKTQIYQAKPVLPACLTASIRQAGFDRCKAGFFEFFRSQNMMLSQNTQNKDLPLTPKHKIS
jgi:hypothetical protein